MCQSQQDKNNIRKLEEENERLKKVIVLLRDKIYQASQILGESGCPADKSPFNKE